MRQRRRTRIRAAATDPDGCWPCGQGVSRVETEEVGFSGAGVRLSGTITFPGTASPSPGMVLVGGSGPSDRHSGGLFDSLSEHLAGAGVAVLAYDKRGVG